MSKLKAKPSKDRLRFKARSNLEPGYRYRAVAEHVVDGDTIDVTFDLGLNVFLYKQRIRLYGINTPEIRGVEKQEGLKAKQYVIDRVMDTDLIIETIKDKKGHFGRWLGIVWYRDDDGRWYNLNKVLLDNGLAKRK